MKGNLLNKCLILACNSHDGQYDKGGLPYILHPLTVMHNLETNDEELQCIALLHDIIEDTDVRIRDLVSLDIPQRIIDAVWCLTKTSTLTYEDYKERVMSNKDAMIVKMADLKHNSDITRLKSVTYKDLERIKRYEAFYQEIVDKRLSDILD